MIEADVHLAGAFPRDRLLKYLKDSDIQVSTSLSDGCSSSLLEAMYLGIPVVVTSIPGNAERISNRVDGLMFDKRDSEALARAITWLLGNPDEAQRMSRMANKRVLERVKWEEATKEPIRRMYNARDASLIRIEDRVVKDAQSNVAPELLSLSKSDSRSCLASPRSSRNGLKWP